MLKFDCAQWLGLKKSLSLVKKDTPSYKTTVLLLESAQESFTEGRSYTPLHDRNQTSSITNCELKATAGWRQELERSPVQQTISAATEKGSKRIWDQLVWQKGLLPSSINSGFTFTARLLMLQFMCGLLSLSPTHKTQKPSVVL